MQPRRVRAHQLRRDLADPRAADHRLVVRDPRPVAEVLEEAARARVAAALDGALARLGEVPLDPRAQPLHLRLVEQPAHDARAIAAVVLRARPLVRAHAAAR
jgi:hypothetical protein